MSGPTLRGPTALAAAVLLELYILTSAIARDGELVVFQLNLDYPTNKSLEKF